MYAPASFVTVLATVPVSTFVALTATPEMRAADASLIVPEIRPVAGEGKTMAFPADGFETVGLLSIWMIGCPLCSTEAPSKRVRAGGSLGVAAGITASFIAACAGGAVGAGGGGVGADAVLGTG